MKQRRWFALKQITESCAVVAEAAENDLLDRSVAQGIVSLKGVRQSGAKAGNWLWYTEL